MQAPSNTGSRYYNYKQHFNIVLLAVADAQYNFTVVDIGAYGQRSDGSVFAHSNFGRMMMEGRLNLPSIQPLQGYSCLSGTSWGHCEGIYCASQFSSWRVQWNGIYVIRSGCSRVHICGCSLAISWKMQWKRGDGSHGSPIRIHAIFQKHREIVAMAGRAD